MKKQTTLMPGIWHQLIIFTVLILLVVNGLPSFFGKQESITIKSLPNVEARLQSETLNRLTDRAAELNVVLKERVNAEKQQVLSFTFTQPDTDVQALHKSLKRELAESADVTLSQSSAAPPWLNSLAAEPVKLGLDLSGGALFVLEVDTKTALRERLISVAQELKAKVRQTRLFGTRITSSADSYLSVTFPADLYPRVQSTLNQFLSQYEGLEAIQIASDEVHIMYSEQQVSTLSQQYLDQALTTMRGRIEQLGITEGVVQRQGQNRIRIEIPGIKDLQQAERLIGATAGLSFHQLSEFADEHSQKKISDHKYGRIVLAATPIFTGTQINDAQMGRDEQGMPLVNLVLDNEGGRSMSEFSKKNIGKPMVTLFSEYIRDDQGNMQKTERVINVATIQTQLGNRFSITNLSSITEAHDLALLLRAGSLEAPVSIVEKRIINASLGEQNVRNGMLALVVGLVLTMLFMVICYRRLGLVANVSLLLNLACLVGLMALTPNAVLTLPGIAGLVLTVGMAVDTNVLIFERIRFERSRGVPPRLAMVLGYKHAWVTILDANITTLICGLVMLSIGYGPVKGFAIALSLGLLTSMFTGVALSKTLSAYLSPDWLLGVKGGKA